MFVRVKSSPNSPKRSVQIVQSVRKGKSVSQRILRHVGTAFNGKELDRLKDLAEFIKAELEIESEPNLFKPETLAQMSIAARRNKDNNSLNVNLKNIREEQRIILGIHEIYGIIYKELALNTVISNPKRNVSSGKSLYNIVMARIANPLSKRASVMELEKDFGVKLSLEGVYKAMDKLDDKSIERLKELSHQAAKSILKERINVVFYDCTTLYFESFSEDELKSNGYSKDMKFNQPQVMLGILTTNEGLPIGYEVYPGSQYEGHTLEDAIKSIKNKYEVEEVIFIADSGMLSKTNLEKLESKSINYIVGARLKNMGNKIKGKITDKSKYSKDKSGEGKRALFKLSEAKRLIVTYSPSRARKDKADREKAIEKLKKQLEKSKDPTSLISNYGYKKYIQISGDTKIKLNEKKLKEAEKWDGLHGVITNAQELSEEQAIGYYRQLWQIEETFRVSKHDLRIRPIYHWTPKRIKSHIAICYMALVCIRHLEYRLKIQYQKLSPAVIRNQLLHVQSSIVKDIETGKKYCIPSSITKHIKKIYQVIGLKINNIPFELK
ncbi:MAG TPA: IS1634 family transposase [Ignavibacteria bacterium]|nr:IS1634 family transposase [Ignavibacteria bacterium]